MKKPVLLFLLMVMMVLARAQDNYPVSAISADLLPRASAVVRYMDMSIQVRSPRQVLVRVKKVVTVLNQSGDDAGEVFIWYNKDHKIKSVKGMLYDQFGIASAKFTEKNFSDRSAASNSSLFEDSRIKHFAAAQKSYPYTIEFEYEIESKQSLNFPEWFPNSAPGVAVERAGFSFTCPADFNIRYKAVNYPGEALITEADGQRRYAWEVHSLRAFRSEPYSPDPESYLTSVKIAPDRFIYQGIEGSFTDWESYGTWMYESLLKGRDEIPAQTAAQVQSITRDIEDPREKARKVYEYMQQKTRYVSIQVGIGGYQPFPASQVDQTHYGDCKALVNYTQGLLKTVGINSYYVVVASGDKKKSALADFASMSQFDHVILAVPIGQDTIWADCTSKENPFGYLGTFTDDRLAVACTPEGGKLIRTPRFHTDSSSQIRNASFQLDSLGNVSGQMETHFSGWQYDNRDFLIREVRTEQLKKIPEIYNIDNIEVEDFHLRQNKVAHPLTVEKIQFRARSYGAINGERMFVPLNRINQSPLPPEIRNRENALYINRGYRDIDSLTIDLPSGYEVDFIPNHVSLSHDFGSFESSVEVKDGRLFYIRNIRLQEGTYPSEEYAALVQFYRAISTADAARLVLKKAN